MSTYGMNYGYMPQQQNYYTPQQSFLPQGNYGPVASSPNYTGGALYGYSNNPYGLYGQNPSLVLAESPYARLTGQNTQLSRAAIPNLDTYLQPMFIDMNAFMGNTHGIPMYPSFIGSTAMQNADKPLYQTYQQYLNQNQPQQPQMPQYPQQPPFPMMAPTAQYAPQMFVPQPMMQQTMFAPQPIMQQTMFAPQPSFGFQQQSFGYQAQGFGMPAPQTFPPQPAYGYQQQAFGYQQQSFGVQQNPFAYYG